MGVCRGGVGGVRVCVCVGVEGGGGCVCGFVLRGAGGGGCVWVWVSSLCVASAAGLWLTALQEASPT